VDDRPLGIVHIAAPAPVGGLERVVQALAIGQRRAGHRVLVIAVIDPTSQPHPFVEQLRAAGIDVDEIVLPGRTYLRERREVGASLRRFAPDVVHTHGYRSDLLDGPVARAHGAAIVSTVHGSSRLGGLSHLFEWMQERAWRRFDATVAVSRALEARLLASGMRRDRLVMIPNAWPGVVPSLTRAEARERLGLSPHDRVLAFVGRLIPAKGPDLFAAALAHLRDLSWRAVVVGDGLLREQVESTLRASGIADRVQFTGHLDEATHLFPAFDVFVLSSRTEGTPIVLFEAMAARVAIVATRVGGVPEVVSDQEAVLVTAGDSRAIAEGIRVALGVGAPARAAQSHARLLGEFGTAEWIARHISAYRAAMARRRSR
jgi:glycosyltransferase involved in cell wall biosynthesis